MKVSNPLTIIAIFAGVAESLATVALIKLPKELQEVFVYFVMAFPSTIVILFFWVLYFKNNVLYAPSDYSNPEHYLKINGSEVTEMLFQEVSNIKSDMKFEVNDGAMVSSTENVIPEKNSTDMTMAITDELLKPALELLVFQLLEKPAFERNKIIESIKNEKMKKMLFSVLSKVKAYVGEESYNKPMQSTDKTSTE